MRLLSFIIILFSLSACFQEKADDRKLSEAQEISAPAKYKEKSQQTEYDADKEYLPHKALYKVTMIGQKSSSQILDVNGDMFYELSRNCAGWITNHSFNLIYSYVDIGNVNLKSDFSTFESHEGKVFEYTSQRKRDGRIFEKYKGSVTPNDPKVERKALYDYPLDLKFDLAKGTIFPIAHTIEILKLLETDQKFYNAIVFDGSDDTGPYEINTFLGDKVEQGFIDKFKDNKEIDKKLLHPVARKVRLAFFPVLEKERNESEYEMTLFFHKNGIVSEMIIEYPEFTVKQSLEAIEALEQPYCGE